MYPQSRRFAWYLALIVLVLVVIKNPDGAAHVARLSGGLLSQVAGALAKLAGAL